MAKRLTDNINSEYIEAANKLTSKHARRKIVVYVESYDDIFFWRSVLGRYEDDNRYFSIMLPSREKYLERGKKAAIAQLLTSVGKDMIACVDADYDYLAQGVTPSSKTIIENPYIFHTYVYAIENYHCYAPGLHDACVMVTLNDHQIFDFENYLYTYSRYIYPLFVWSIWFYRHSFYNDFTITDFNKIVEPGLLRLSHPGDRLEDMRKKIEHKTMWLQRHYPRFETEKAGLEKELEQLGVVPDNTYLFVQGHHLFDNVVVPVVSQVCERLVREREDEIKRMSIHAAQEQTEMSCYTHSIEEVSSMLKKNTIYQYSAPFQHLLTDVEKYLNQ
jgi:hypothetical protein